MKNYKPKSDLSIFLAINSYLSEKSAIGALSIKSVNNRRYELNRFEQFCKAKKILLPSQIHKNVLVSYLKSLKISKASKLNIIYVLIGFMDYLVKEDLMIENYASIIDKPKNTTALIANTSYLVNSN